MEHIPKLGDRVIPGPGLMWHGRPIPRIPHTVVAIHDYRPQLPDCIVIVHESVVHHYLLMDGFEINPSFGVPLLLSELTPCAQKGRHQ